MFKIIQKIIKKYDQEIVLKQKLDTCAANFLALLILLKGKV
jgi:hypothetical protein